MRKLTAAPLRPADATRKEKATMKTRSTLGALALAGALAAACGDETISPTAPTTLADPQAREETQGRTQAGQYPLLTTTGLPPIRHHSGPNIAPAPSCASNPRITEKHAFGQEIPYDGKRLVGVIYVEWDWDAALCSDRQYRTAFEIGWVLTGGLESEEFYGYGTLQPTTHYLQYSSNSTYGLRRIGTQVYHQNHWNEPTWTVVAKSFTLD
jgi:hypothetical protein